MLYCFKIFSRFEKDKTDICQTYIQVTSNDKKDLIIINTIHYKLLFTK